jgi:hypothetical protein
MKGMILKTPIRLILILKYKITPKKCDFISQKHEKLNYKLESIAEIVKNTNYMVNK